MELEQECEDFIAALDLKIRTRLSAINNSSADPQTPLTEYYDQVLNLKEDDERDLGELKVNIKEYQNKQETLKAQLAAMEKKKDALKREKEAVLEQKVLKQKHLRKVKKDHESHKSAIAQMEKQLAQGLDKQSNNLDRNKSELKLYQQMSGISWDFEAPSNLVRGYITNKETNYLRSFCFDMEVVPKFRITEGLWEGIHSSSLQQSKQS